MNTRRFTPWIVLACIGTLAACTSGGGTAENTELNVIVPADPSGTGTPSEIDIQVVEYTIDCQGNSDVFLDNAASFPDEVTLNGSLEVVDGRPAPPGSTLANSEIWQGFMDLPPGPCTVQLRARDGDGEVICTATEPFSIAASTTTKVDIVLICDISFQAPVGMLDVDGTFSFNVGNFCPDLFVLNCLDSAPAEQDIGIGVDVAITTCQTRFRDGDSTCGQNCDPQNCVPDPTGLICTPGPEPVGGVSTTVTCVDAQIDCDGNPATVETSCTFSGDTTGTIGGLEGTFNVGCIPPALGGTPGVVATCTAVTTDGDLDCDKTKEVNITCPGLSPCTTFGGDAACEAADGTVCVVSTCNEGTCDGATAAACCDSVNAADGLDCSAENPPLGSCQGGVCNVGSCVDDATCETPDECTFAGLGACDLGTGLCGPPSNEPAGTPCSGGTGACDGAGTCIDNCTGVICDDGNECTDDPPCDSIAGGICPPPVNNDTNVCTTCPSGPPCACSAGSCDSNICICIDSNDCTQDVCDSPSTGTCSNPPEPSGTSCDAGGGAGTGSCDGTGLCIDNCTGVDCSDGNECTQEVCDSALGGFCSNPSEPSGTSCDAGGGLGSGSCNGAGLCIDNCAAGCSDANDCTQDLCDSLAGGVCSNPVEPSGTPCSGGTGLCDGAGLCIDNCTGVDCSDANDCTQDVCDSVSGGTCSNPPEPTGTLCDFGGGPGGGTCDGAGTCTELVCATPVSGTTPVACRNSFNQGISNFLVDMTVTPDACITAGGPFNATVAPTMILDTTFLQAAADILCTLSITLTQADLLVTQARIDALTGAACTSQLSELSPVPQTVILDVTLTGVCGAGGTVTINSGITVPLPQVVLSCTAGAAPGPVGFCATGTTPVNVLEADPPVDTWVRAFVSPFAANFACGQGAISEATPCISNADCTVPGTSCNLGAGTCTVVFLPFDPTIDCITFPVDL